MFLCVQTSYIEDRSLFVHNLAALGIVFCSSLCRFLFSIRRTSGSETWLVALVERTGEALRVMFVTAVMLASSLEHLAVSVRVRVRPLASLFPNKPSHPAACYRAP